MGAVETVTGMGTGTGRTCRPKFLAADTGQFREGGCFLPHCSRVGGWDGAGLEEDSDLD